MGIGLLVGGVRTDPRISWTPPPPGGVPGRGGVPPFGGGYPALRNLVWEQAYYGKIDENGKIDD